MSGGKRNFITGVSLILVCILLIGCLPNKKGGLSCSAAPLISKLQSLLPTVKKADKMAATGDGPTRKHPPVRTGDITIGPKVEMAQQSIGTLGGTIAVSKPGDPLDGFVIDVPPNSYTESKTFKVYSASITKQTFGSDINPISPIISVDNSGGYAGEVVYVRVPVKVPEDSFAMGFIYDEKTKQLEGMPLVGSDAESVTLATMHFSSFFVSAIKKALLKSDIDSGFRPGMDDWQFTNRGSYISPGGHCEGQTLSAMWYYCTQPDGKDLCLYGRYDNNGEKPATPDLWEDDSLGYRFCSVVQDEKRSNPRFWDNLSGIQWKKVNNGWQRQNVPGISDETTFDLFTYSIRATGEPQEVAIRSNAGGGHAMIVYKVVGNALYIADPNYPGNTDRKIIYYSGDGKFKPYQSGANREEIDKGNSKAYEKIIYCGKSTVVPWDVIAKRWAEFKAGTIGNDKFPAYKIVYEDDKGQWQELKDGYISPNSQIRVDTSGGPGIQSKIFQDGKFIGWDYNYYGLKPGNNLLGFGVDGLVTDAKEYIDFKYINVIYGNTECKTGWVLESATPTVLKHEDDRSYYGHEFNFADGSVSGKVSSDDKDIGGNSIATTTTSQSWTPLPKCIKPDETKLITYNTSITIKVVPPFKGADKWAPHATSIHTRGTEGQPEVWEDFEVSMMDPAPQTASNIITLKTSNWAHEGNGSKHEVTIFCLGAGGSCEYLYTYVWRE